MAINFPDSPTISDTFIAGNSVYQWDGTAWRRNGKVVAATISTTEPTSPNDGDMWFKNDTLDLYIYYDDGTSQQWVQVGGGFDQGWQLNDSSDVHYSAGRVGIGTSTPLADVHIVGTGAIIVPVGGNADQIDIDGAFRLNSDNGDIPEIYGNASWMELITEFRGQRLKNKTFEGPTKFETQTANWTGATNLDPDDGLYLEVTLTGNTTLSDTFNDGENMTLQITDADSAAGAYTITWPTITWFSNDGVAPTLQDSSDTLVSVWKAGTTLYGFAANGA